MEVTPQSAREELFGARDDSNPASVAAYKICDSAVCLIYGLTGEERKAYDPRHRTWPTEVLIKEYEVVDLFATEYNILPIQTPNLPTTQEGDSSIALMLFGHFPPDIKGAESHLFLDKEGEGMCSTYDLLVSASQSVGYDLCESVAIFGDVFPGVVPIETSDGKQFTSKRHLSDKRFAPIQKALNELNVLRFRHLRASGYSSVSVLLFGLGKLGKDTLQEAADNVRNFDIRFTEVGHPSALAIARPNITLSFAKKLDEGFAQWLGLDDENKMKFFR